LVGDLTELAGSKIRHPGESWDLHVGGRCPFLKDTPAFAGVTALLSAD
jgi:hypothetical protein